MEVLINLEVFKLHVQCTSKEEQFRTEHCLLLEKDPVGREMFGITS